MRRPSRLLGTASVAVALFVAIVIPVAAAFDPDDPSHGAEPDASPQEGLGFPSFNESQNCGRPGTSNPLATGQGWLADGEPVRGYKGGFFGRSIGDIRSRLVPWEVPMSGGNTIMVHPRALPAFKKVSANLAAEQSKGRYYQVNLGGANNETWGYAARTVGGSYSISHHALGTTIDINSTKNPYRADGALVTDMPTWFVDAWRKAGFCWGGDWVDVKDAMHFSWMGPTATPGYGTVPKPYPPWTSATDFGKATAAYDLPFGQLAAELPYVVTDATGNGVADVIQIKDEPFGMLMEYSRTSWNHDWCAVDRTVVRNVSADGRVVAFGDRKGQGRTDLWLLDTSGTKLGIEVIFRQGDFTETETIATTINNQPGDGHLLGDHNRDGVVDLFVIRRTATDTRVQVFDGSDDFATKLRDVATPLGDTRGAQLALGDRNVDDLPDLYVAKGSTLRILNHGYGSISETIGIDGLSTGLTDLGVNDYDGDGRDDLFLLRSGGRLDVRLGNVPRPGVSLTSWFVPNDWTCAQSGKGYEYDGSFRDDDGNPHEADIDFIAGLGITKGCNPPINDEYCPTASITRGQMAAFLDRALGLPPTEENRFIDDGDSIFEGSINKLAAAGVTKGCNPPANDRYCPNDTVTRGQMAAFLVRGFELGGGSGTNAFVDDDISVFERDIDILATTGVTKGCNPPANSRFCPDSNVTRAQMASFLARAIKLPS